MTINNSFDRWFAMATTHDSPRRWQKELADEPTCRDRLIRIRVWPFWSHSWGADGLASRLKPNDPIFLIDESEVV